MGLAHSVFIEAFDSCEESIMDYANGASLSDEIWDKDGSSYVLKPEVREKALELADWAIRRYKLKDPTVRLIGSMCSNAYSDDSDLDVHITDTTLDPERREEINDDLWDAFKREFEEGDRDMYKGHPFELYVQENKFRDLLSAGCYNIRDDKWESGPMLYPEDYDPFAEYYEAIYRENWELLQELRDFVMSLMEFAFIASTTEGRSGKEFSKRFRGDAQSVVEDAKELLRRSREMRGALTEPESAAEALATRDSDEWKLADASFKLFGKFGYISVVKKVSKLDPQMPLGEFCAKLGEICRKKLFGGEDREDSEEAAVQAEG